MNDLKNINPLTHLVANTLSSILAGAKGQFAGIRNYKSSTSGEVANHTIRTAVDFEKAANQDAKKIANASKAVLQRVAKKTGIDLEIVKNAHAELTASALRNLNDDTRTNQSKGQIDAYANYGNGVRVHKETGSIKIYALAHAKTVIIAGDYPHVNSRPKTIAKKAIEKELNLKRLKVRNFSITNSSQVKINGNTITIV